MFVTAIALSVLLPLVLTGVAVARVRNEPQVIPVARARARQLATRPARVRYDFWSGFSTGVIAGWLLPSIVGVVADRMAAPEGSGLVARAALILAPLAVYAVLRPRGRYALGMAAGAAVIGVVAPLVFITLFAVVGSVADWS